MDKYEYQVHADEIKKLIGEHRYAEAMNIADGIDWRKVRSVSMLQTVSEIYKFNKKYEEAREILMLAYDRYPNRNIVYALCELAIKLNDVVQAKLLYEEFVSIAPNDTDRYVLLYKLYEALDVSMEERIELLEEFKQKDYTERWAYELALLYHKIGQETKCVEACDELILWFGEGKYVKKAMELKMKHTRLSTEQQRKYDGRQEPIPVTDKFMSYNPEPFRQVYDLDQQSGKPQQIPLTPYSRDYQQGQMIITPKDKGVSNTQDQQVNPNTPVPGQTPVINTPVAGQTPVINIPVPGQTPVINTPVPGQTPVTETPVPGQIPLTNTPVYGQTPGMNMPMTAQPQDKAYGNSGQHTTQMLSTSEIDKIEIKPVNVGMYNTIDLQNGLSENIKKFFENEQSTSSATDGGNYDTKVPDNEEGSYDEEVDFAKPKNDIELTNSNGPVISLKNINPADNELDEVPGKEEDVQITTFMPPYKSETGSEPADDRDEDVSETDEDNLEAAETAEELSEPKDPELQSIYEEWENKKKENEEKRIQEAKVLSLQQTADIMAQLKDVLPEIDDIAKPAPPRGDSEVTPYFTMPEEPEPEPEEKPEIKLEERPEVKPEPEPEPAQAPVKKEEKKTTVIKIKSGHNEIDFAKKDEEEPSVSYSGNSDDYFDDEDEPVTDGQADYPETEELAEINTPEDAYPEEPEPERIPAQQISTQRIPTLKMPTQQITYEAERVPVREISYEQDRTPTQEIFYVPERADDFWEEEEAMGKTEEMPIREISYEPETKIGIEDFISEPEDKEEPEIQDNNDLYFREIMNIEDSDEDEEMPDAESLIEKETGDGNTGLSYSEDEEAMRRAALEATTELPEYPYQELEDYGEVEEMAMIEQPEGLEGILKTDDMPVDAIAKANYEAGLEFDTEGIDELYQAKKGTDSGKNKKRPGYMKLEKSTGSKRDFDDDERLVFGRFQEIEWLKSKIVDVLDTASMEPGKGNVIVMGDEPVGRKAIAVDIVKVMRATEVKLKGKVAKISGEALNKKDIPLTIKKLRLGALIVENAHDLTPSSARLVAEALELENDPVLVILEGDTKGLTEVINASKDIMTRVFDARIELQEYTTDDLVAYGRSYARELEYTIDDMGILALYRKIGDHQTLDHQVTFEEVCEIIDNAIKHVDKKNMSHFMDVLLAKRYDDNDFIILREKDFMQ